MGNLFDTWKDIIYDGNKPNKNNRVYSNSPIKEYTKEWIDGYTDGVSNRLHADRFAKDPKIAEFESKCKKYAKENDANFEVNNRYDRIYAIFTKHLTPIEYVTMTIYENNEGRDNANVIRYYARIGEKERMFKLCSDDIGYEYLKDIFSLSLDEVITPLLKIKLDEEVEYKRVLMASDVWIKGIFNKYLKYDSKNRIYKNQSNKIYKMSKEIDENNKITLDIGEMRNINDEKAFVELAIFDCSLDELRKYRDKVITFIKD